MKRPCILVRCGSESIRIQLGSRDFHVLDNHWHMPNGGVYRQMLGMDYIAGLGCPAEDVVLLTHERVRFAGLVSCLKNELEAQGDLLVWHYSYSFGSKARQRLGGGESGFRVRGLWGYITVRPSGYCDLRLSAVRGERTLFAELIDMRVIRSIETDDRGPLKAHRRRAPLLWYEELPKLLAFLQNAKGDRVEILHSQMPEDGEGSENNSKNGE